MPRLLDGYYAAERALRADGVLCSAQIERLGGSPDDFPSLVEHVRVQRHASSERQVRFHALELSVLRLLRSTQMVHMAGLAEMRMMRKIPPDQYWHGQARPLNQSLAPDGLLYNDHGPVALFEYDAGFYVKEVMHSKLTQYSQSGLPTYWGAPSQIRISRWAQLYPRVRFLHCRWWD